MNSQIANTIVHSASRPQIGRGAVVCGLWLRVAFIGASAFVVGLLQLLGGEMELLPALALTVVGGVLAGFSARRARSALDVADEAASTIGLSARSPAGALAI